VSIRKFACRAGILLSTFCVLTASALFADNPAETWNFLSPIVSGNCQATAGPEAQDAYTIGVIAGVPQAGEPLQVFDVTAGGPAAAAGVQKGDSLWGIDAKDSPTAIDSCELLRRELSGSKDLVLYRQSSDHQERTRVTLHPKLRREVYPGESQMQWKITSEYVDGGRFRASGALAHGSLGDFELRLGVYNLQTGSLLQLDESKIFLLDDQGAQFAHQSFAEWKQSLEKLIASANALAQGMESIPYVAPPPPPPPTHYHVSSSADGTYVLTPMGGGAYQVNGQAQVESIVSPEYTPNEQIGQAARSIASIFDAIRTARTNKEINKLRQRAAANAAAAEKLLGDGTASHLETVAPIAPGARRTGAVAFVQPKNSNPSIMKAIFVVSDTSTKKEYFVTFQFKP
jgi:hypothetical protein